MSSVRVVHGSATVELDSDDVYVTGRSGVLVSYRPLDLVAATVAALRAADFEATADLILNALDREGISL